MAKAFILSPRISDQSIVTASGSISNAVVANILSPRPRLYWRSDTSTPYIEGNFGNLIYPVDTLFFGYSNSRGNVVGLPGTADLFRFRMATSQANLTASPGYDPGWIQFWPTGSEDNFNRYLLPHRVWTFEEQEFQWYRVDFNFANGPYGYTQLSRLILGKRIEPNVSVQSKWAIGGTEEIAETVDMGGEESARIMGTKRSITVTWHDLVESERELLYSSLLERGSSKDIVLAIEPSQGIYAMSRVYVGRVKHVFSFEQTVLVPSENDTGIQHFTVSLTVSELAPIEMNIGV